MVFVLECTIRGEQGRYERFVGNQAAELRHERCSHSADPGVVGRNGANMGGECVTKRTEDELDRVGQCAVEIEQKSEWAM